MKVVGFAERLRELIEENKYTQQQLADELDVVPSTLSGYVNKSRVPEYAILMRLSRIFHTSCDYLIGNSVYRTSEESLIDSDENRLIELYRKMDDRGKDLLMKETILIYQTFKDMEGKR